MMVLFLILLLVLSSSRRYYYPLYRRPMRFGPMFYRRPMPMHGPRPYGGMIRMGGPMPGPRPPRF